MKEKKPKMSRKERERLMIEEMESAIWEQKKSREESSQTEAGEGAANPSKETASGKEKTSAQAKTGKKIHCSRCRSLMENGKCPTCGHYIYMPMDDKKRKKIRLIVGGVCVLIFAVLFVVMQSK